MKQFEYVIMDEPKKKKKKHKNEDFSIYEFLDYDGEPRDPVVDVNMKLKYHQKKQKLKSKLLGKIQTLNQCGKQKKSKYYVLGAKGKETGGKAAFVFRSSQLWNGRKDPVNPNSQKFKYRYLTMLYDDVIRYLDAIVETEFRENGRSYSEYDDKIKILNRLDRCLESFQTKYLSGKTTLREMLEIEYYFSKEKPKKKGRLVEALSDHLGVIMDNRTVGGNQLEDYVLINDLIKLAYVAVTENPNIGNTHRINGHVTFNSRNQIRSLLIHLGDDILAYESEENLSLLYQEYRYARPAIMTSFQEIHHNQSLRIGIRALHFLAFVTNSKEIESLIRRMT